MSAASEAGEILVIASLNECHGIRREKHPELRRSFGEYAERQQCRRKNCQPQPVAALCPFQPAVAEPCTNTGTCQKCENVQRQAVESQNPLVGVERGQNRQHSQPHALGTNQQIATILFAEPEVFGDGVDEKGRKQELQVFPAALADGGIESHNPVFSRPAVNEVEQRAHKNHPEQPEPCTANALLFHTNHLSASICGTRENVRADFRTCLHKKYMWIFEHNFVADKAKIRRWAVARQVFFTQYATKFAEKTRVYACEDRFLFLCCFGEVELVSGCLYQQLCRTLDAQQVAVEEDVPIAGVVDFAAGVGAVVLRPCLVHLFDDALGFRSGAAQRVDAADDACLIGGKDVAADDVVPLPQQVVGAASQNDAVLLFGVLHDQLALHFEHTVLFQAAAHAQRICHLVVAGDAPFGELHQGTQALVHSLCLFFDVAAVVHGNTQLFCHSKGDISSAASELAGNGNDIILHNQESPLQGFWGAKSQSDFLHHTTKFAFFLY